MDFLSRSYSDDTLAIGPSITLGYADREPLTATSYTNGFNGWYNYNVPKTISRPSQSIIYVKIYNLSYAAQTLLVDTTNAGVASVDMTQWMLTLSFIPID